MMMMKQMMQMPLVSVGGGLGDVAGVGALGGTGGGLLLHVRGGVLVGVHAGADPSLKTNN